MADDQEPERWIEIHRPIAGLVQQGSVDQVPIQAASDLNGFVFDDFCLTKDSGCVVIGNVVEAPPESPPNSPPLPQSGCRWGAQLGTAEAPDNSPPDMGSGDGKPHLKQYQIINNYLYVLDDSDPDPDNWEWVGAASLSLTPNYLDSVAGNGYSYVTHVQDGHRVYFADGTDTHRFFDLWLREAFDWGTSLVLAAPTVTSEDAAGGLKLADRSYSFRYTYESSVTGQETNRSAESNVWHTAVGANTIKLHGTIPANPLWTSEWDIANLFSSPGALSPSVPAVWKWEKAMAGVTGLDTTPLAFTSEMLDGNLGREAPDDNGSVPRAKFIVRDPRGDAIIAFGNPTAPNRYYWPKPDNIGAWPLENADDVDDDETDYIGGGFNMLGRFYLLKRRRGIWMLSRDEGTGAYHKDWLTSDCGIRSHQSIVVVGTRAFWLSSVGFIEFSGQSPKIISTAIRDLMVRLMRSPYFDLCHGVYDRRANSNCIRWFLFDPDAFEIEVIYDLTVQSWTTRTRGRNLQNAAGRTMVVPWQSENTDGTFDVLVGDNTGRVFQLHRDEFLVEVWSDAGYPYDGIYWTPWLGNGIDSVVPTCVQLEMERAPLGVDGGDIRILIERDGEAIEEADPVLPLWDENNADPILKVKKYAAFMATFKRNRGACRRYRVGASHPDANGRPKIHWLRIQEKALGDRVKPLQYGGGPPPE